MHKEVNIINIIISIISLLYFVLTLFTMYPFSISFLIFSVSGILLSLATLVSNSMSIDNKMNNNEDIIISLCFYSYLFLSIIAFIFIINSDNKKFHKRNKPLLINKVRNNSVKTKFLKDIEALIDVQISNAPINILMFLLFIDVVLIIINVLKLIGIIY